MDRPGRGGRTHLVEVGEAAHRLRKHRREARSRFITPLLWRRCERIGLDLDALARVARLLLDACACNIWTKKTRGRSGDSARREKSTRAWGRGVNDEPLIYLRRRTWACRDRSRKCRNPRPGIQRSSRSGPSSPSCPPPSPRARIARASPSAPENGNAVLKCGARCGLTRPVTYTLVASPWASTASSRLSGRPYLARTA